MPATISGREFGTEAVLEELRAVEGPLHGELLIEEHAHEEGEPVGGEKSVCLVGLGEGEEVGSVHWANRSPQNMRRMMT